MSYPDEQPASKAMPISAVISLNRMCPPEWEGRGDAPVGQHRLNPARCCVKTEADLSLNELSAHPPCRNRQGDGGHEQQRGDVHDRERGGWADGQHFADRTHGLSGGQAMSYDEHGPRHDLERPQTTA